MAEQWEKGDYLQKKCPLCGGVLVVRANTENSVLFVGCESFPSCTMSRSLCEADEKLMKSAEERARSFTGMTCSVCNQPQFSTPSGVTCKNGHGGAPSVDPKTGAVTEWDDEEPGPITEHVTEPEATTPTSEDVFEEDGSYQLHVEVSLDPVDDDLEVKRVDTDPVGVSVDLDRARIRREAGHDVAAEVVGRMLPQLIEAVRRVLW